MALAINPNSYKYNKNGWFELTPLDGMNKSK